MKNIALLFPGQGAQTVGMGKDFYDNSPEAKQIFDEAQEILGNDLLDVVFNGPQEKLTQTAYCQPGIVAFSIAALEALKASSKWENITPAFTAGLSLGEYGALAASGAVAFPDTIKLIERRSAFMELATKSTKGTMAAIIGLERDFIEKACKEAGAEVANFNAPGQIVITGLETSVLKASEMCKDAGAKSVIPLDVSGAFHSSLMQSAADKFGEVLAGAEITEPTFPILSNVDAQPETNPENIRTNLAKQITSSVQWIDTIEYIKGQGITDFIEIGPGKVLKGLLRRIDRGLKCHNIEKFEDIAGIEV